MYLKNSGRAGFVALHEGSILGDKTQPTTELFAEEKYPWIGHVTCKVEVLQSLGLKLMAHYSRNPRNITLTMGSSVAPHSVYLMFL